MATQYCIIKYYCLISGHMLFPVLCFVHILSLHGNLKFLFHWAKYSEVELLPRENDPVFTFYFESHLQEYFGRVARIVQRALIRPGEQFLTRTTILTGTSQAFGLKKSTRIGVSWCLCRIQVTGTADQLGISSLDEGLDSACHNNTISNPLCYSPQPLKSQMAPKLNLLRLYTNFLSFDHKLLCHKPLIHLPLLEFP